MTTPAWDLTTARKQAHTGLNDALDYGNVILHNTLNLMIHEQQHHLAHAIVDTLIAIRKAKLARSR